MIKRAILLLMIFLALNFKPALSQVTSYVFTANQGTWSPVNGTPVILNGNGTDPLQDEGYANNIPIGFTFNYLGANYTSVSASTNGFASFSNLASAFFSNNLLSGIAARPLLAPLWEDLSLASVTGLQYATTGGAGSRIFTLQWNNVRYDFGAGAPSISFQLRLHETSNKIEFIYNQLPSAVQDFSGGASIGITDAATGAGNFLSLSNSSAAPQVSSASATNNIVTRPASGQVYTFMPPSCVAPGNLNATGITTTGAVISWTDGSAITFEYVVSTNAIPPSSGTATSATSAFAGGLAPGTKYYLHVRKNCASAVSQWASYSFATLCEASGLPYTMPISSANPPALPVCTNVSDNNQDGNTWRTYPSAGAGWTDQVMAYVYNNNATTPANDWLFTAGLNLNAGIRYRLKFKYNNDATTLYTERLKVACGLGAGESFMTNVLANYISVSSPLPKTASIDFIPAATGVYYIGFHAYSDADKNVLILDDIVVDAAPSCDFPVNIATDILNNGTSVQANWQDTSGSVPSGYEYAVSTSNATPASGTLVTSSGVMVDGLLPFTKYYLHVRSVCGGAFSEWSTKEFATIGNDEPCHAIPLTQGGAAICGNTTLATSLNDPGTDCSNPNNSVWFRYTAIQDGTIVLKMTTPASPANPLNGWVTWYDLNSDCPNLSLYQIGACRQFGGGGNNDTSYLLSPVLVAGNSYYIMIDGFSDDIGEFCISIPSCSPAVNIKVEDIISTSAKTSWSGTGSFVLEYGLQGFNPGTGGVFAGIGGTIIRPAQSPQLIQGLTLSTSYDVYVRQDCSSTGNGYSINSSVVPFTTLGPPPANDECSGAISLTVFDDVCGGATAGTTLNATGSSGVPLPECNFNNTGYDDDVWFSFTPAAGQQFVNIIFTNTGGNADLVAQIYRSTGNNCSNLLIPYECSDDDGNGNMPGFLSLPVTADSTYYIRVYTQNKGVNGQFTICITKALLINDNASGAIGLIVGAPCTGASFTNTGATHSSDEPTGSCSSTSGYASVWYSFVAPAGGAVRISTALGSGNSLTNTRVALFSGGNVNNYESFHIISCDEDGGSGAFDNMSVLYATGLTEGWTYYIQVDKYDSLTNTGTFCITVEELTTDMLSTSNTCGSTYQVPVGSVPAYDGWVPLMDSESKLIALVVNPEGGAANSYTVAQHVKAGPVRMDSISGEYYLNRNYKITNTMQGNANIQVQLFYLDSELAALQAMDPAAAVASLRVTHQASVDCLADFIAASGANTELPQASSGSQNGVSWIRFNTVSFSNFYIHSTRAALTAKAFLQGAYNGNLRRHKDVSAAWANVLNTYARNQPYNTPVFGNYAGTEAVPPGFFTATADTTDIIDWVLLEVKNSSGFIISRRAAFIREDGLIVDIDKVSPVSMSGQRSGNFYIAVRHRNHLSIRSGVPQPFAAFSLGNSPPDTTVCNYSTAQSMALQNAAITTNAAMAQSGNVFMMWAGNANADEYVRVTSQALPAISSDAAFILGTILGGNPGLTFSGYSSGDINLDGNIRTTTLALPPVPSDVSFILGTVLNGNSNATRREHK